MFTLLNNVLLRARIIQRALAMLPKKQKEIELLYFNSITDVHSRDTLIVRYDFKNVLWYQLDGLRTTEGRHIFVRPENSQRVVELTAHGLFRKSRYAILIGPEKVSITGL